jgi:hypothetical protein
MCVGAACGVSEVPTLGTQAGTALAAIDGSRVTLVNLLKLATLPKSEN